MTGAIHPFLPSIPLISGIDIALWDLAGKLLGQPITKLLGGPQRDSVPMYSHGDELKDMNSLASCRDWAKLMREQPEGFTTFKIEPNQTLRGERVGPVVTSAQLRKIARGFANVREAVGEDIDIGVHCHNQWDTPSAIAISRATEEMRPLFYEDPLSYVEFSESWMAIKQGTRTPILTGEKLEMLKQFKPFIDSQAVDIIHPDLLTSGGMAETKHIAPAKRAPTFLPEASARRRPSLRASVLGLRIWPSFSSQNTRIMDVVLSNRISQRKRAG